MSGQTVKQGRDISRSNALYVESGTLNVNGSITVNGVVDVI